MLTLEDCEDFTGLSREEIKAIAVHERISEISAAATGNQLARSDQGIALIKRYILDDASDARAQGDETQAQYWERVYRTFVHSHPS